MYKLILMIKNIIGKVVNIFKGDKKSNDVNSIADSVIVPSVSEIKEEPLFDSDYVFGKIKKISDNINSTLYSDIMNAVQDAYMNNSKNLMYDIDGDNRITINDITTLTSFWHSIDNPVDLSYFIKCNDSSETSYSYIDTEENSEDNECYGFYGRKIEYCTFKSSNKVFPKDFVIPAGTVIATIQTYNGFELPDTVEIIPWGSPGIVNKKNGNISLSKDTPMALYGLGINATCNRTSTSYYI